MALENPTPIRVRGKKRNRSLVTTFQSQISQPAKRLRGQGPSKSTLYLRSRKKKQEQVISAMPTLQGLPQELLEIIFLYSMNISLPRAAPDLGRKLSSQTICQEFCLRSFFENVDHKTPNQKEIAPKDPVIQSQLLACRFFTWPFFLTYVQKAHDALIKLRGKAWAKTGVTVPDATYFDELWPFKFTKIGYLGFAEGFRVPEKLLHGPWTSDKSSLLYVLVSFNGSIDWEGSMAGETAKEGLSEAVETGDERAVAALTVLLGVAGAITTQSLRHAVVECGCDFKILRHMLFNAQILYQESDRGVLDFHDPVLWQWADEEGREDGKGEVLKDMLKRAEKFDLEFYQEDETDWSAIVPFPYSGGKFDPRTAFTDIGRELLGRLYRNYGRKITRGGRTRESDEGTPETEAA